MTNTEKPTTKTEQKKQEVVNTVKQKIKATMPVKPEKKDKALTSKSPSPEGEAKSNEDNKKEEVKKEEKKKPIQKKPVVKKTEAVVNVQSLPISTKYSVSICKFIKNKKIGNAIADLEQVLAYKKAVPMKGEIPHKKGKGMMSGRYPKKATEHFIKLLKSLSANVNVSELNNPVIVEAIANLASRPYGRFGRMKRKRTHVKIIAREKKKVNKGKEKK